MAESVNMLINGIKEAVVNNSADMFYALFILIAGYIIAVILAYVVRKTLQKLKVDNYIKEKGKIPLKVSSVVATVIKWYLILIVLHVAISQLGRLDAVALQLQSFISFIPTIIVASVVLLLSYFIGIYVKEDIFGDKEIYSSIMGQGLFFLVVLIGVVMSLSIINIDTFLISAITVVLIGSLGLGVAIALGLGLKDIINELARDYIKKYKKN
ncbi:MAG: hypothetical protein U9Q92_00210 [archaeon]|nr:hypothetical protein [archaeon]